MKKGYQKGGVMKRMFPFVTLFILPVLLFSQNYNYSIKTDIYEDSVLARFYGGGVVDLFSYDSFLVSLNSSSLMFIKKDSTGIFRCEENYTQGGRSGFVYGNNVFIGSDSTMYIIDVSSPLSPYEVSEYLANDNIYGISVYDTLAFLSLGTSGFSIVNINDINNPYPVLIDSTDTSQEIKSDSSNIYTMNIFDDLGGTANIRILGYNDSLFEKSSITIDSLQLATMEIKGDYLYCTAVYMEDDIVYVLKLYVYDISDPYNPVCVVDDFNMDYGAAPYEFIDCDISDSLPYLYVVYTSDDPTLGFEKGFVIVNVEDPTNPYVENSMEYSGMYKVVASNYPYVYIYDYFYGIRIMNVANIDSIYEEGSFYTYRYPNRMVVDYDNGYVYMMNGNGFQYGSQIINNGYYSIMDISDMSDIRELTIKTVSPISFNDTYYNNYGMDVLDNRMYLMYPDSGLRIVDISDKYYPQELFSGKIGYACNNLCVVEDTIVNLIYLLLATDSSGLVILDVTDESNVFTAGVCDINAELKDVKVYNDYAYFAAGDSGIVIVDVSDKNNPVVVSECSTNGNAIDVEIDESNNILYALNDSTGMVCIDVSDKENPTLIGEWQEAGDYTDLFIDGIFAYLCDNNVGLRVLNISNPQTPYQKKIYTDTSIRMGEAFGDYKVLGTANGIAIYDIYTFAEKVLNNDLMDIETSFNKVKLEIPYDMDISVDVVDIAGRKIKTLYSGWINKGEKEFNMGNLSRGTYFVKIKKGDITLTERVMIVK